MRDDGEAWAGAGKWWHSQVATQQNQRTLLKDTGTQVLAHGWPCNQACLGHHSTVDPTRQSLSSIGHLEGCGFSVVLLMLILTRLTEDLYFVLRQFKSLYER